MLTTIPLTVLMVVEVQFNHHSKYNEWTHLSPCRQERKSADTAEVCLSEEACCQTTLCHPSPDRCHVENTSDGCMGTDSALGQNGCETLSSFSKVTLFTDIFDK